MRIKMTNWLIKHFVRNYNKTQEAGVRTAYGILAGFVGIVCNIILFLVKLLIGMLIQSISVMADAFNNLSDAASSLISLIGAKLAQRPADAEHPFGHGRYEYISALIVAFLILQVGFSCFQSSVGKILNPKAVEFQLTLVVILILSILLKLWLAAFNRTLGKRINSEVLKATAADAAGDVLITGATVLSLMIGKLTGFPVDGIIGAGVSVFVLISGFKIAKDTLEPLLGKAASPEVCRKLIEKIESYDMVVGTHDLIVHNYGPTRFMATIHAEVPNTADFEQAHETVDLIEREIFKDMNIFLVIHMDPVETNDSAVLETKALVAATVKELEPKAGIHDFRLVNGERRINLVFDMLVPYSYTAAMESDLTCRLISQLKQKDPRYECIITVEHSYIAEEV